MPALPAQTPVIAGPTAGGKSDLAVALALAVRDRLGIEAEIITADAFQIYTGMDIGTAKPSPAERRGIPHHLIDLRTPNVNGKADPSDSTANPLAPARGSFTVDEWLRLASARIAELRGAGKLPIVVGGTHLYIKALLDGLFDGPEPDAELRARLAAADPATLREELQRVDPAAAERIHPNDLRRTIRAIEVFRLTGQPITAHQKQWDKPDPNPAFLLVILDWEPEALNRRINQRVRAMVDAGLLGEIRSLLASGPLIPQAAEALGYKQLLPLASGPTASPGDLEAAVERIKIETRRFAKNQRTWLRRLRTHPGTLALTCPPAPGEAAVERILSAIPPL